MPDIAVILKAGWGDGSKMVVSGFVNDEEYEYLNKISDGLEELVEVVKETHHYVSNPTNILDYVKWWVLCGDDTLADQCRSMPANEFINFARAQAPLGYR